MKKVVVVIPIYKQILDTLESASFVNNIKKLKRYDVVVIHPVGLNLTFYRSLSDEVSFRAFDPYFFNGIKGYNRLMISPLFYRAFSDYTYLLICHYDAWVFKDELEDWCDRGYDLVAAPFLNPFPAGSTSKLFPFLRNICLHKIGNGGFSLRKVSSCLSVARRVRIFSLFFYYNEDVFWALVPSFFVRKFKYPDVPESIRFSARMTYEGGVLGQNGELPFGCHGWYRPEELNFWKQYIKVDES